VDENNETPKPKRYTASLVARWIFGIFLVLMFMGALIEKSVIGAILLLL
jgi:hypothetical protein